MFPKLKDLLDFLSYWGVPQFSQADSPRLRFHASLRQTPRLTAKFILALSGARQIIFKGTPGSCNADGQSEHTLFATLTKIDRFLTQTDAKSQQHCCLRNFYCRLSRIISSRRHFLPSPPRRGTSRFFILLRSPPGSLNRLPVLKRNLNSARCNSQTSTVIRKHLLCSE